MSRYVLLLFAISLVLLLGGRFLVFFASVAPLQERERIQFTTTLLSEPKLSRNQQSFTVYYKNAQRITIHTGRFPQFHYGDRLLIDGKVKVKTIRSLGTEKTVYSLSYPTIHPSSKPPNVLVRLASMIRKKVSSTFHLFLPQPADSLLMGIVFGINEGMPDDFQTALQNGGVLHVIAASGMNVTMVSAALFFLLCNYMRRQKAVLITIIGILFYAVLSGLQPSILRASIMGILVFAATLLGRQNTALVTLGVTGYVMLLWKPILLTDVGFQLSFLSTLGIILLKPLFLPLEKRLSMLEDITTTISAQIATLPIVLMTFGQYGLLSVLVNALILWTIPILMVLGSIAALLGLVAPVLSLPFLYLSLPFLWFFIWVVTFMGKYNLNFTVSVFPVALSIGYYLFLSGLLVIRQKRQEGE